jgi:cytoskeletal protein CcmA (bactofilin family)
MKHFFRFLIICCLFIIPTRVHAVEFRTGDSVTIPEETIIEGNLFVAGNDILIKSEVTGDIMCAGKNITVAGPVGGDVLCVGQAITVSGDVMGSVRTASQNLSLDGSIERNVTSVGQNIGLSRNIGGDVFIGAGQVTSNADIKGSLYSAAESVYVNGSVHKDANISANIVNIGESASIAGTLTYESQNNAVIADGSVIGSVSHMLPAPKEKGNRATGTNTMGSDFGKKVIGKIWSLIILLGLGILYVVLAPKQASMIKEEMESRIGLSFAVGLFSLIAIPTVFVILVLTIIGIPFAALFVLAVAMCALLARFGVALVIGSRVLAALHVQKQDNLVIQIGIGYVLTWLVFSIPVIGGIFEFIFGIWGLGGVVRAFSPGKK